MTSMKSCWLCVKVVNSISRNFFSLQSCIHKGRNHHTYSCVKVVPAGKNWYLTCEIPEFISRINPHISHLSIIWGRCYLKRSRRTLIFLPDYKISSLKITLPKTLQLKTLDFLQKTITMYFFFFLVASITLFATSVLFIRSLFGSVNGRSRNR